MPKKKKQPDHGEEVHQETITISSPRQLTELLLGTGMHDSPFASPNAPEPSYSKRPYIIYLYICLHCGWWTISSGVDELFGSLVRKAGPRTEPCERCQLGPMYLVKREDALHTAIESQEEVNP